ncbi:hypothetical protein M5689_025230 [Euphorbia peplus]|nr:hypothetical protein M5689_025230 [Euphorbia peplus]
MGNGYNHHQNINLHQKPTFLPMLCSSKPSMKDVSLPCRLQNRRSMSFSGDPLSPKISCMGQLKRHNTTSNKISISSPLPLPNLNYSKLKRIFSAKNPSNLSIIPKLTTNSRSCREKGTSFNGGRGERRRRVVQNSVINIEEMDPPLPVIKIKKVEDGLRENESLWKRRSGGDWNRLRNLQLQHIQINRSSNLEPITV